MKLCSVSTLCCYLEEFKISSSSALFQNKLTRSCTFWNSSELLKLERSSNDTSHWICCIINHLQTFTFCCIQFTADQRHWVHCFHESRWFIGIVITVTSLFDVVPSWCEWNQDCCLIKRQTGKWNVALKAGSDYPNWANKQAPTWTYPPHRGTCRPVCIYCMSFGAWIQILLYIVCMIIMGIESQHFLVQA